jgi:Domain of unknown function (DUF4169)
VAEIVNLRQKRKRKARDLEAAKAAENRQKFGAPGPERELEAARRRLSDRTLDGARRERENGE